jgi:hypothetical protein
MAGWLFSSLFTLPCWTWMGCALDGEAKRKGSRVGWVWAPWVMGDGDGIVPA